MTKYSAMIVDDSEIDRYLLKRFLNETTLFDTIFEETDGQNAVTFFETYYADKENAPSGFPPVIVFLDVNMPRMNGFEFLEQFSHLSEKHSSAQICIMMFTSSGAEEDIQKAFSFSCVKDYIEKGNYTAADIKAKVEKRLI